MPGPSPTGPLGPTCFPTVGPLLGLGGGSLLPLTCRSPWHSLPLLGPWRNCPWPGCWSPATGLCALGASTPQSPTPRLRLLDIVFSLGGWFFIAGGWGGALCVEEKGGIGLFLLRGEVEGVGVGVVRGIKIFIANVCVLDWSWGWAGGKECVGSGVVVVARMAGHTSASRGVGAVTTGL